MSTLGLFNTSNWAPNQLEKSFNTRLLTRYPGTPAMLTALSARFKKDNITSHRYHWMGNSMVFPRGTLTANLAASGNGMQDTIYVDDATTFVPGAVIRVNGTGEQMLVTSILGEHALLVRRQFGISPAMPIGAGAEVWQIGTAYEEGSLRPLAKSYSYEEWDNITQIFRNTWALTGTVVAENPITGEKIAVKNKKEAAMFHAIEMEMAMIWGERHQSVHNGQPIRKMDGIISQIQQHAAQNIHYAAATTSFKQLGAMVDGLFDVSTDLTSENDRALLVGNRSYAVINELGKLNGGQVNITNKETKFGMQFSEFSTNTGNFKVVKHPLFNLNSEWASMALVLDFSSIEQLYLRRTVHNVFNPNINSDSDGGSDGMDAQGGTYLTEMTTALLVPEANGVIYGLCQAAADCPIVCVDTYLACFDISHPCSAGPVSGGSTVFLTITNSKPNTVHTIAANGTTLTVTTNAQGNATVNYTMPMVAGQYAFALIVDANLSNVQVSSPVVVACVPDCIQVKVEANSCEPTDCAVAPVPMEQANCPTDVVSGVGSTQS